MLWSGRTWLFLWLSSCLSLFQRGSETLARALITNSITVTFIFHCLFRSSRRLSICSVSSLFLFSVCGLIAQQNQLKDKFFFFLVNSFEIWSSDSDYKIHLYIQSQTREWVSFSGLFLYHIRISLDANWLIGLMVRLFANGLGDLSSIPGHVMPKTLKMILDTSLFNI